MQRPKKKMTSLAERGLLLAIDHHPEIVDSDGVPGVDFVISRSPRKRPPKDGYWYDPIEAILMLPTGRLRIVYDEQSFEPGYRPAEDETYLLEFPPGFYKLSFFTRVFDSEYPGAKNMSVPDLAVFMTPSELLQHKFRGATATVPIFPPDQQTDPLGRRLPGKTDFEYKPGNFEKQIKKGFFQSQVRVGPSGLVQLPMQAKDRKKFGYTPGTTAELTLENKQSHQTLHVLIAPEQGFDPSSFPQLNQLKRKFDNLFRAELAGDTVVLLPLKESRKSTLTLNIGDQFEGSLTLLTQPEIPQQTKAKDSKHVFTVNKKLGDVTPAFSTLMDLLANAKCWTVALLFDLRGTSHIGAIDVWPPDEYEDRKGRMVKTSADIMAVWAKAKGKSTQETQKKFRGYPDGVLRAFKWIHSQAKKEKIWMNQIELKIETTRNQKVDRRAAKKLMKEVISELFVESNP